MILDEIVKDSQIRLESRKRALPLEKLKSLAAQKNPPGDFLQALRGDSVRIIAEVKKASPSKGLICRDFDPVKIAGIYAASGAAAISVITDVDHFQGQLDYLRQIDQSLGRARPPLLRKDFIFDRYQIYESRANGADALLLIVAILNPEKLGELLALSHELGIGCLVEVHDAREVEIAVKSGARIIGINNRDLQTFQVDITNTQRLRQLIPEDRVVVSESGIKNRSDIERLRSFGVNAVLIGETLVASADIATTMKGLL